MEGGHEEPKLASGGRMDRMQAVIDGILAICHSIPCLHALLAFKRFMKKQHKKTQNYRNSLMLPKQFKYKGGKCHIPSTCIRGHVRNFNSSISLTHKPHNFWNLPDFKELYSYKICSCYHKFSIFVSNVAISYKTCNLYLRFCLVQQYLNEL